MNELKLNKGDKCYIACGKTVKEAVVAVKRVTKNGSVTYFVDVNGFRNEYSFNGYGHRNYKTWQDAVWSRYNARLFATKKEAEKDASYYRKSEEA